MSDVIFYADVMPRESLPDEDRGYLRGIRAHADSIGAGVGGPDLLPVRRWQRIHSLPLIATRSPGTVAGIAVQWGTGLRLLGNTGALLLRGDPAVPSQHRRQ